MMEKMYTRRSLVIFLLSPHRHYRSGRRLDVSFVCVAMGIGKRGSGGLLWVYIYHDDNDTGYSGKSNSNIGFLNAGPGMLQPACGLPSTGRAYACVADITDGSTQTNTT